MTKHFVRLTFLSLISLVASGCAGYTVGPIKPTAMANVQTIAIPLVKNDTLEPRVAPIVTNAIISQMEQDGTYKLASKGLANATLEGKIVDIERRQLRSARTNQLRSNELNLRLKFEYEVIDNSSRRVLLSGTLYAETSVFVSSNYQTAERQAIPDVARRLAIDLTTRISEGYNTESTIDDSLDGAGDDF